MRRLARLGLPGLLAAAATLTWPAAVAQAQTSPALERAAWFSASGGAAQPAAQDDLRVARAVRTTAFSALLYRGNGTRAGLELTLRDGAGAGTPDVVACPTVGVDWADGGNQSMDAAPEVDCDRAQAHALLADDGLSLSFGLDRAFEVAPGTWSIALVPAPSAVVAGPPPRAPLPFTTDLQRPEVGAFVLEEEFTVPTQVEPLPREPGTADPGATGSGVGVGGGFAALPSVGSVAPPPLDPAVAPALAPAAPPPATTRGVPLTQAVALRPTAHAGDDDAGRRLLALLALAFGSAAVGYAAGQQRPGPRLLGGRARLGGPEPVPAAVPGADRPRGIGRFARERDAAPRRLR